MPLLQKFQLYIYMGIRCVSVNIDISAQKILKLVTKVQSHFKTFKKYNQILKLIKLIQLSRKVTTHKLREGEIFVWSLGKKRN